MELVSTLAYDLWLNNEVSYKIEETAFPPTSTGRQVITETVNKLNRDTDDHGGYAMNTVVKTRQHRRLLDRSLLTLNIFLLIIIITGCANPPRIAKGTYRLPFIDGTQVGVSNSFFNHNGEYDLYRIGSALGALAAAAPGWVRFIEDSNFEPTSSNNYIWIEHPYPYCQAPGVTWPGKPANYDATCTPCEELYCNEWSKYSHPATNTVTSEGLVLVDGNYYALGAGLSEDDWVEAGDYIGVEGDVGMAGGIHVHWEVVILNPNNAITNGGFSKDWTGGAWPYAPNLMPYICTGENGDTSPTPYLLYEGDVYDAQPCPEFSNQEIADRKMTERIAQALIEAWRRGEDISSTLTSMALTSDQSERVITQIRSVLKAMETRDPDLKRKQVSAELNDVLRALQVRDPTSKRKRLNKEMHDVVEAVVKHGLEVEDTNR